MAEKLECDRCKIIGDPEDFETIKFYKGYWEGTREISLCSKCNKKFVSIFKKFMKSVATTGSKGGGEK